MDLEDDDSTSYEPDPNRCEICGFARAVIIAGNASYEVRLCEECNREAERLARKFRKKWRKE